MTELPAATSTMIRDVLIRPAGSSDIEDVARIWHDGWADGHAGHVPDELYSHRTEASYPSRVRQRIEHTWVAQGHSAVVGFVVVVDDELEQIYVARPARGRGVAGALLSHAERVVAHGGHPRGWLAVVAGNARARAFYERSGWADAGAIDYRAQAATGEVIVPCRRYEKSVGGR